MKCPKCGEEDNCKYVFVIHEDASGAEEIENPTDYHFIFLCPNLHIYDGEKIIKSKTP